MVLRQADRARVVHFVLAAATAPAEHAARPGARADQVALDRLIEEGVPATAEMHPTGVMDPTPCTLQLGRPGPWSDRIPHFRMGFTPSSGKDIQSECLLPRRHAVEAFAAVRGLSSRIQPLLSVTEIRTVAADQLLRSMNYREDSLALHFAWKREQDAVERITAEIEEVLAPSICAPYWGKLFTGTRRRSPRSTSGMATSCALQERLDPRGAFCNQWLQSHVLNT